MRQLQVSAVSEARGPPCPVEPPIWKRLQGSALKFKDKMAVASLHQPAGLYGISKNGLDEAYLRWSYSELLEAVDILSISISNRLAGQKVPIVTILYSGVECIIVSWAAYRLGCPFVPLSPKALANTEEFKYMLELVGDAVVVAQDKESSEKLDILGSSFILKLTLSQSSLDRSWTSLSSIFAAESMKSDHLANNVDASSHTMTEVVTILLTSGTTSRPKGVPHNSTTLNAFSENLSLGGRSHQDIFCCCLPNNHAMGYFFTLHFMMNGGSVVYPSSNFDGPSVIKAINAELATHVGLVPTMIYTLCEVLAGQENSSACDKPTTLKDVCLAGSAISPAMVRKVRFELGSQAVSIGFGMTEGSPIWSEPLVDPDRFFEGPHTVAGNVVPGARVKLCEPGTRDPVPLGTPGEIHQTGPGLVGRYLNGQGEEYFYEDQHGLRWFITGDQAIMHPDGRFSITGRYKDIIIRGGKNISPTAIELVLSKHAGITAQVVGVPDAIAGELPFVVTDNSAPGNLERIRERILEHMGPEYVPGGVFSLQELDLQDFPKTVSGKVQKSRLAAIVTEKRANNDARNHGPNSRYQSVKESVLRAYNKATGIPVENLDLDLPTVNFADSITLLRVRDALAKSLGATLSIEELTSCPSINSQIDHLASKLAAGGTITADRHVFGLSREEPPTRQHMSIILGGDEEGKAMIDLASRTLSEYGLGGWKSVSAIFPVQDYTQVLLEAKIIDTWNFAIAVVCKSANKDELRSAVKATLANHPIFTSFYLYDISKKAYHVTVKAIEELWSLCLIDYGSVSSREMVQQLAVDYPFRDHATEPGPLFRALLLDVEETGSSAMVFYIHHLVHDASSQRLFLEDLELALKWPEKPLKPHIDYKVWCDSFAALRMSPKATAAVKYHVKRLKGIHKHAKGLYPRAPLARTSITTSPDGLDYAFDVQGLRDLQKIDPTIIAAVVLKAAMAIVDVNRTGHTHALFNNFEASRKRFPFMPDGLEALSVGAFQASDVNGPVMQGVCNLVRVDPNESIVQYLHRLQMDQRELTTYADAPLKRVIEELNADGSGDGDMTVEVHRTQFLTWVPGFLGEYENIDVAQLAIRCDAGLVVVAGLGGPTGTMLNMTTRWDVANYSRELTAAYLKHIELVMLWMIDDRNFHKPVSNLLSYLAEN